MSIKNRLSKLTADLLSEPPTPAAPSRPRPELDSTAVEKDDAVPADDASPSAAVGVETRFPPTAEAESEFPSAATGVETRFPPAVTVKADASGVETRFPLATPRPTGKKTGPGEMLAFRGQLLAAEGETELLRQRLAQFGDALPTRKLDPRTVFPSKWANRHESHFQTPAFARFKAEIDHAGGNQQPILVRPIEGRVNEFETVFGHRRHRACLETGHQVLSTIWQGALSDAELFAAMDRENREREDLSPWEQGKMYSRALAGGLYPSQRRMGEALGVSHTWIRKTISVWELPEAIVLCFRSPLEVSFRHAEALNAALEADRKGTLKRAEKLKQSARVSANAVVSVLVGNAKNEASQKREIRLGTELSGKLTWDERGQATIRLLPGVVHADNVDEIVRALLEVLAKEKPAQ